MTIIVLLILAGVSLNAIIGENGIVTNAMRAKEVSEKVGRFEDLQMALANFSTNGIVDNGDEVAIYEIREEYKEADDVYEVKTHYVNPDTGKVYGVGSGAGYIEVSNGSYDIYDENSDGKFVDVNGNVTED